MITWTNTDEKSVSRWLAGRGESLQLDPSGYRISFIPLQQSQYLAEGIKGCCNHGQDVYLSFSRDKESRRKMIFDEEDDKAGCILFIYLGRDFSPLCFSLCFHLFGKRWGRRGRRRFCCLAEILFCVTFFLFSKKN